MLKNNPRITTQGENIFIEKIDQNFPSVLMRESQHARTVVVSFQYSVECDIH